MAKVVLGIVLGVAGLSLLVASVWMFVDKSFSDIPGLSKIMIVSDAAKFGIAASILTVIIGITCCFVKTAKTGKLLIFGAVCAAFVITMSCCGIAIRDRVSFGKHDKLQEQLAKSSKGYGSSRNYNSGIPFDKDVFSKVNTQLVVISVISGVDALIQIVVIIMIYLWSDT